MTKSHVVAMAALVGGLLALGSSAHAGRGIRVDIGSGAFDLRGESWNENTYQEVFNIPGLGDPIIIDTLPFGINFSGMAGSPLQRNLMQGPTWVNLGRPCPGSDPFGCGTYALLWPWQANDYQTFKLTTKSGQVDREADANGEFSFADALPAVQFRWFDKGLRGESFDYQVILFDVSELTGVDGDFDVEVNFGYSNDVPLPPGGQALNFGPDSQRLATSDPALRYTNFCFRSGALNFDCAIDVSPPPPPPPPPTTVPTPGSLSLFGIALSVLVGGALRRRRSADRALA